MPPVTQVEMIPPAEYLRMSYYESGTTGLVELLVASGLVTRAEIESGKPAHGFTEVHPAADGRSSTRGDRPGHILRVGM